MNIEQLNSICEKYECSDLNEMIKTGKLYSLQFDNSQNVFVRQDLDYEVDEPEITYDINTQLFYYSPKEGMSIGFAVNDYTPVKCTMVFCLDALQNINIINETKKERN